MRFYILALFIIVSAKLSAYDTLRIGAISDTHFLSEKLMKEGSALDSYVSGGGKNIRVVPEVLTQVLDYYVNLDKLDVLLISGDMTKDGEKESHLDFVEKLQPLQEKGVRIFVVPGNHYINMPNPMAYIGSGTKQTDNVTPKQFEEIYKDFGYNNALSRDRASLSYAAQLDSKTWLLTLDVARYGEYTNRSISSGRLKAETEAWALTILEEAREKDIQVIGMMHWGLVEHIMYQSSVFEEYLVDDWQRLAQLFADNGMRAIFTGHFHSNDISATTTSSGHTIYDIETSTLAAYPFAYRTIDYFGDGMDIKTRNVVATPSFPNLAKDDEAHLRQLAFGMSLNKLKNMGYDLPEVLQASIADILARIFVLHVRGDEQMDDELRAMVTLMASMLDSDEINLEDLELDSAPADNDVTLFFQITK